MTKLLEQEINKAVNKLLESVEINNCINTNFRNSIYDCSTHTLSDCRLWNNSECGNRKIIAPFSIGLCDEDRAIIRFAKISDIYDRISISTEVIKSILNLNNNQKIIPTEPSLRNNNEKLLNYTMDLVNLKSFSYGFIKVKYKEYFKNRKMDLFSVQLIRNLYSKLLMFRKNSDILYVEIIKDYTNCQTLRIDQTK